MAHRVLLSAPYLLPVIDAFRPLLDASGIELVPAPVEERLSEDELMKYAGQVDGVVCGDDQFSQRVLAAFAPRLKVISKWGTGIDSIDCQAAERLGVRVCNTPGAFAHPVADTVMAYILLFARRTPWMDREMKAGRWDKIPGKTLRECTLGVVGVGHCGREVLRRAKAFGMHLLGNDVIRIPEEFLGEVGVEMLGLEDLLRQSDFVSLNCDLNPTSFHLVNSQRLALLSPRAVLVNASRGPVVDEPALVEALRAGRLAGAALDVFEQEPLPLDSPLRSFDNVLLAPHNANSSPEAWARVHRNTLRNLLAGLGLEVPAELEVA
ncbi:MAG: phosphoglycerate dehydrogenase [Chloroflexi bacterium]|nr:phosphoglycerate dehydrogenase [Chloroflexota bacterium]